jgi:SAM-dependent MidA family methyltransferase
VPAADVLPWEEAWHQALYGPDGFYRRPEGPAGHFRTSSHVPLFAEAIARLAADLDASLGEPEGFTVVDVGAGRGELLEGLAELAPDRWTLLGVDVVGRPAGLDAHVGWASAVPEHVTGLVMAHELLDVVPCPVVELDASGLPRLVGVDRVTGVESLGEAVSGSDRAWLEAWWPLEEVGERAEVGAPRDRTWSDLVARVAGGGALAVDYAHSSDDRGSGRWARGSLVGHRRGRVVPAVPDGSCDVTARVALDACAAATAESVDLTFLTSQREALLALGVQAVLPDPGATAEDPQAYVEALQRAGQARELTDPQGLGDFGWLLQLRGVSPAARARG